jgi:hypothetical protein
MWIYRTRKRLRWATFQFNPFVISYPLAKTYLHRCSRWIGRVNVQVDGRLRVVQDHVIRLLWSRRLRASFFCLFFVVVFEDYLLRINFMRPIVRSQKDLADVFLLGLIFCIRKTWKQSVVYFKSISVFGLSLDWYYLYQVITINRLPDHVKSSTKSCEVDWNSFTSTCSCLLSDPGHCHQLATMKPRNRIRHN